MKVLTHFQERGDILQHLNILS